MNNGGDSIHEWNMKGLLGKGQTLKVYSHNLEKLDM